MKLWYSPTSPYVRKVLVTAIELGIRDQIELVRTDVWDPATTVGEINPLGRIPALETDDGEALYDSPVICEFLDARYGGHRLLPIDGDDRWRVLRLQALADGLLDAAFLGALELRRRPEALRWQEFIDRQRTVIGRALDRLEHEVDGRSEQLDLGLLAAGCALGYADLRYPDIRWRDSRPRLAAWYARIAERDSFRETAPPQ